MIEKAVQHWSNAVMQAEIESMIQQLDGQHTTNWTSIPSQLELISSYFVWSSVDCVQMIEDTKETFLTHLDFKNSQYFKVVL